MVKARNIDYRSICEELYGELDGMKGKLSEIIDHVERLGPELKERFRPVIRHLDDIINTIEWKKEIFTKVCPFDFSGYHREAETTASVPLREKAEDFSPGYVGG
ncbi:MAG: hypothetical protein N2257_02640 [Thermodesulfovibrionales bacterium]|nr:hypothetical protein [Thermodesulfovibrionales bacterium]